LKRSKADIAKNISIGMMILSALSILGLAGGVQVDKMTLPEMFSAWLIWGIIWAISWLVWKVSRYQIYIDEKRNKKSA